MKVFETGETVDPRAVWSALRRGWSIVAVGMVIGAMGGFLVNHLIGPQYSTAMQFFVSTSGSASTSDAFQGSQLAQQRVASYTELLSGAELAERVVARADLGDGVTPARVAADISATTVPGTVLIDVTVTDSSRTVADAVADAVAVEFPALVGRLETSAADAAPVDVALTDRPGAAVAPVTAVRDTLFGMVLGLLAGAVAAVARALLDRTVRDKVQAEDIAGAPVTGVVFRDQALARADRDAQAGPGTTEQYRKLAASLQYLDVDAPPKVIMVTSAVPAEGKTTTVVNLALALTDAGARVTIVEADLRRPRVTACLGLVSGVGLTNVLAGTADLDDVLQYVGRDGLRVVSAGPTPPSPGRLLGSAAMRTLLAQLRGDNDYVLVDAAPLLPVADSRGIATLVDGVLLAVRHGKTTGEQLGEAADALAQVGARTLGVVLTMVPLIGDMAEAHAYGVDYGQAVGTAPLPDAPVARVEVDRGAAAARREDQDPHPVPLPELPPGRPAALTQQVR